MSSMSQQTDTNVKGCYTQYTTASRLAVSKVGPPHSYLSQTSRLTNAQHSEGIRKFANKKAAMTSGLRRLLDPRACFAVTCALIVCRPPLACRALHRPAATARQSCIAATGRVTVSGAGSNCRTYLSRERLVHGVLRSTDGMSALMAVVDGGVPWK